MKLSWAKIRQEKQLVPLIPDSDQRVGPNRTKLHVLLLVAALCLLLLILAVFFFLFPRPVDVSSTEVESVSVSFDNERRIVYLNITGSLDITNNNYYPVYLTTIMAEVRFTETVIGKARIDYSVFIRPLAELQVDYTVPTALGDEMSYMFDYCTLSTIRTHSIIVEMQVVVTTESYFGHAEQHFQQTYNYVDCGENSSAVLTHPLI